MDCRLYQAARYSGAGHDGLNFTIPYLHNGKPSDYLPDFVIRLAGDPDRFLIAEVKGADWGRLAEVKAQAPYRWCAAVNATAEFGYWQYALAYNVPDLRRHLDTVAETGRAPVPEPGTR